jgi:hypothetical protein
VTAPAKFYPGGRAAGPAVRGIAPLSAYKAQGQSVASATVFVNDDALLLQLAAGAVYYFACVLGYNGASSGSGDIDLAWSLPSGASMGYSLYGNKGGVATPGTWGTGASVSLNTGGAGTTFSAVMQGAVAMSPTPGALQLTWKQNTTNGTTPTSVVAGSELLAWRVQ